MSDKTPSHFWRNLSAAVVGLAAIISAGVAVKDSFYDDRAPVVFRLPDRTTDLPTCQAGWNWDDDRISCVRKLTIPAKSFTIKTDRAIVAIDGRIDFYLNTERQPGTNAQGQAMYKAAPGSVQVVIPIMHETTMIGDMREVIFHTSEGNICSIDALPESTDWMKKMRVSYNIRLNSCGDLCRTSLSPNRMRIDVYTSSYEATISDKC